MPRVLSLIAPLALLPALIGCNGAKTEELPVLAPEALNAVVKKPGVDRVKLARDIDAFFTEPALAETRALLVMYDGRIVAERYAPGYHENTRFIGWSMSKSITAVMIGLLISDGRLKLDEAAPIPQWQRPGDPRGEITVRQLLQMRSGLRHTEAAQPPYKGDEVRMLFLEGRSDTARYAENQPLEAEPGSRFKYSTATSVILSDLAGRVLAPGGDPQARQRIVADYLRTRLFEPVGMRSVIAEYDAAGTMLGGSMIHASARDWARFGEFLRNSGSVRGAQIVPRGWIGFMTAPSPNETQYGAHVWLNREPDNGKPTLFPARGPRSLFACVGHLGQYVLISPSQKLVVVRLGKTPDNETAPLVDRLADIVALFPRS